MLDDITNKIKTTRGEALKTVAQVNSKKKEDEERRRREAEDKKKKDFEAAVAPILNQIPDEMQKAALNGYTKFKVKIPKKDVIEDTYGPQKSYPPARAGSPTLWIIDYLDKTLGMKACIWADIRESSGPYNETDRWVEDYYLEISY